MGIQSLTGYQVQPPASMSAALDRRRGNEAGHPGQARPHEAPWWSPAGK